MQNQAEHSLRESCGDGDGQGKDCDEYECFHWTCYRQVAREMQGNAGGLGRNLHPRAFACFHENPCADQTFDDASGGVGRDLQ